MVSTRSVSPLSAAPQKPRSKFGNVLCRDDAGHLYHSKAERAAVGLLFEAFQRGDCSEPKRRSYAFELNGVLIGRYTSDAEIEVFKAFKIVTKAAIYEFEAGRKYTIDVKSPATKTTASNLRFKLMHAFFGILVFEVLTRAPQSKRAPQKLKCFEVTP